MARITVRVFIACADLTVQEMSSLIGMTPDKCWMIGDLRGATGKTFETNSWILESVAEVTENPLIVSERLEQSLDEVLRRIGKRRARFRRLAFGRTSGMYIRVLADENLAVQFKAATLCAIACLGTDLKIDLMTGK